MRLFVCQNCGGALHFENRFCQRCGLRVGYDPRVGRMIALEPGAAPESWRGAGEADGDWLFCDNAAYDACNWLKPAESGPGLCAACRHNGVIPDLSDGGRLEAWRLIEIAKHRLFYSLYRWRLPAPSRADDPERGLVFEFLADDEFGAGPVLTGHEDGRIVIALAEANDLERERRRLQLREPYRTLLGHFRHEVGHYYWDRLIAEGGRVEECRALFGDESADYQAALSRHYESGPPPDWPERYVSAYATMHPWEDFAETWAHYLHVVDGLETAAAFGLSVAPRMEVAGDLEARIDFDPYDADDFDRIINGWIPLTIALNSINRSVGLADVYPFVLGPVVVEKMRFIHRVIRESSAPAVSLSGAADAKDGSVAQAA